MSSAPERSRQHPACMPTEQLAAECEVRFQRRSGPGGQHRNKVETSVHLCHRPSGVTAHASERRSQADNLRVARVRLRIRLALEVRHTWSMPSVIWTGRVQQGRLRISREHEEFAGLLAEALDCLSGSDWLVPAAAEKLGCTTTQLVRFLKLEPLAFQQLNRQRASRNLPPLR